MSLGQSSQLLWTRPLPSSLSPSSGNCCLPLSLWAEELSWHPMITNPKVLHYSLLFRMVFSCPAHTFTNHLFIKIISSFPNFSVASTSAEPLTATYPLRDLWKGSHTLYMSPLSQVTGDQTGAPDQAEPTRGCPLTIWNRVTETE